MYFLGEVFADMTVVQMEQTCAQCRVSGNQGCLLSIYLGSAITGNTYFDNE